MSAHKGKKDWRETLIFLLCIVRTVHEESKETKQDDENGIVSVNKLGERRANDARQRDAQQQKQHRFDR